MSIKLTLRHLWNKFLLQLSFILLAFYLIIGFLFLFSDYWIDFISEGREIIGLILIGFGALRFYSAYSRYKTKHHKIQELKKEKKILEESQHEKVK